MEVGRIFLSLFVRFSILLFIFFKSLFVSIIFGMILSLFFLKREIRKYKDELRWRINIEFKDALQGISAALNAGYSIENSFTEAIKDLKLIYGDNSKLIKCFEFIEKENKINENLETSLRIVADELSIKDFSDFTEIFSIAKRTGGDLVKIIKNTSDKIGQKIEVTREIKVMISQKKLELKIMEIIPPAIIVYLQLTSSGLLECIYTTIIGRILMVVMFVLYEIAILIGEKIINIRL